MSVSSISPIKKTRMNRTKSSSSSASRKSRVQYKFSVQDMAPFFHMSQKRAAKEMGVAVITLKRCCKRNNIRWPYRAMKFKVWGGSQSYESPYSAKLLHQSLLGLEDCSDDESESDVSLFSQSQSQSHQCHYKQEQLTTAARDFARLPYECMASNELMMLAA